MIYEIVLECWYKYHRVRTVANAALDSCTVGQKPHVGPIPARQIF